VETIFGRRVRNTPIEARERELMVGSLLGDATLLRTTSGFCFRVHHGLRQRDLVDWKHAELARLVRTAPRQSGNGYYFRTVTHPEFSRLREHFYVGSRKVVPLELLREDLTVVGLATWIMDDGAADGNQLRINTQSFSAEEAGELCDLLRAKFGLTMTVNMDKGHPRLRCAATSMPRLVKLIEPHVLPNMLYKLSL
jgi:LAGLIDADG DNA endonuclease family